MKFSAIVFACLIASAYSREIVIRYVDADDNAVQPQVIPASKVEKPVAVQTVAEDEGDQGDQSDEEDDGDFFTKFLSKSGDVAGNAADTAGRIAKAFVDVPAALATNAISAAGKSTAHVFHKTGKAAARTTNDIENGFKNILADVGVPGVSKEKEVPELSQEKAAPSDQDGDFFTNVISRAGDLAADTADTAGRIASGIIDVPSEWASNSLSEAGKGTAEYLHNAGDAAARAAQNVENGIKNIFSSWGKR